MGEIELEELNRQDAKFAKGEEAGKERKRKLQKSTSYCIFKTSEFSHGWNTEEHGWERRKDPSSLIRVLPCSIRG
jgi:hypothetical protein